MGREYDQNTDEVNVHTGEYPALQAFMELIQSASSQMNTSTFSTGGVVGVPVWWKPYLPRLNSVASLALSELSDKIRAEVPQSTAITDWHEDLTQDFEELGTAVTDWTDEWEDLGPTGTQLGDPDVRLLVAFVQDCDANWENGVEVENLEREGPQEFYQHTAVTLAESDTVVPVGEFVQFFQSLPADTQIHCGVGVGLDLVRRGHSVEVQLSDNEEADAYVPGSPLLESLTTRAAGYAAAMQRPLPIPPRITQSTLAQLQEELDTEAEEEDDLPQYDEKVQDRGAVESADPLPTGALSAQTRAVAERLLQRMEGGLLNPANAAISLGLSTADAPALQELLRSVTRG